MCNKKMIIAITGYVGAGKSTAADVFAEHDFLVIDADKVGHSILDDEEVVQKLAYEFGKDVLTSDIKINRDVLSDLVFNNPEKLKELNRIVHPKLERKLKEKIKKFSDRDVVIEAAVFEELNLREACDKVLLVEASIDQLFMRVKNYSQKQLINIMNAQKKVFKPDFEIENNGSIEDFKAKIALLIGKLRKTSIIE